MFFCDGSGNLCETKKRKTEEGFELGWVAPEEEEDYLGIASTALNYVILK